VTSSDVSPPPLVQLVASLNPGDAVSDFAREIAAWARHQGRDGGLIAGRMHPACSGESRLAAETDPADRRFRGAVLLYHHSIGAGLVEWVERFAGRVVVVHHSITPPSYFESWSPAHVGAAELGQGELARLARATASAWGVSEFDAGEARAAGFVEVGVLPIAPARTRLANPPDRTLAARLARRRGPTLLTVGRLAPNKRLEVLLAAHSLLERAVPDAWLEIVGGDGGFEGYGLALRSLARELGLRRVEFRGSVTDAELVACYQAASLFVFASEHEGRGLPLLEAMHHGVPVIARRAGAVPETVGDAAILLDGDDPERWAEEELRVLSDAAARGALVARGRDRAAAALALDWGETLTRLGIDSGRPTAS